MLTSNWKTPIKANMSLFSNFNQQFSLGNNQYPT